MKKMLMWKSTHSTNTCPSCMALHGQVHSAEDWGSLKPKGEQLYCKEGCNCTLTETDEHEMGSIADAPFRQMMSALDGGSAASAESGSLHSTATQIQIRMAKGGEYEIIAISAGKGNGYTFPAATLRAALSMWNRVPCYIDHEATPDKKRHSARDLAGLIHSPKWSESEQGIQALLKPTGPSADALRKLADAALEDPDLPIGFSADIFIDTTDDKTVTAIKRVISTDAVLKPARGGKFLRVLQSILKGDSIMKVKVKRNGVVIEIDEADILPTDELVTEAQLSEQIDEDAQAVRRLLAETERQKQEAEDAKKVRASRVKMCEYLLDTALTASKLPNAAQSVVRKQFTGKVFEPTELEDAIEGQRKVLAEFAASSRISGPGRTTGAMFNTDDQLEAAVDDLFGTERRPELKNAKPARLSGIKELYLMLTGDVDFHGGYYGERISLATTADFAGLVKNALNKIVVNSFERMGTAGYDWWKKIVLVEHFTSLQSITGTLVGTIGSLPSVAEQGEYTELAVGDSPETASFTKYGGYLPLTLEAIDRDETRKLKQYSVELGNAAMRNISEQVAAIFTSNSAVGPTMADTGALFNNTAVTTAGGHANLLTTALGTDYVAWNAIALAMYNQPMLVKQAAGYYGTGKKLAVEPKYCLVPRALRSQAEALFMPRWASNPQWAATIPTSGGPTWGGVVEPVVVPDWTDATDYAAVADPAIAPSIILGERFGLVPEIYIAGRETDPAVFMNDEHRIKVRQFIALVVGDFRPLHKENV
jgi:hypothetical protein